MIGSHYIWSHSLAQRIGMLRPKTIRVAFLAVQPDYGTFRYRCFNPVDAINKHSKRVSASYFFYKDLAYIDNLAQYADVLVVSRCPYDAKLDRLFRRFKNASKKIIFDIDDLVFDPKHATLVASNLGYPLEKADLTNWTAFICSIGASLNAADEVVTTTEYLGSLIRESTNAPVHIVPNTFNNAQQQISDACLKLPRPDKSGLHIGYFSGSLSHSHDFSIVKHQIQRFLEISEDSRLTVVGHLEIPKELSSLRDRILVEPFMDFLAMQDVLLDVDLNIVPLQESLFAWSKSELKFFEAALVETPTLASRNPVFSQAIEDGITGFLADSTSWLDALVEINSLSKKKLESVGQAARKIALKNYSPQKLALKWENVLEFKN